MQRGCRGSVLEKSVGGGSRPWRIKAVLILFFFLPAGHKMEERSDGFSRRIRPLDLCGGEVMGKEGGDMYFLIDIFKGSREADRQIGGGGCFSSSYPRAPTLSSLFLPSTMVATRNINVTRKNPLPLSLCAVSAP